MFLNLSICLLGFTRELSPIIGMLCFSISLSLGTVSFVSSIPIILPLDYIGTALGIVKSTSNIGTTIYNICVGFLQDLKIDNNGGNDSSSECDYVIRLYFVTSFIAVIIAVVLSIVSKKYYDGVLDMNDNKRTNYCELKKAKNDNSDGIDSDRIKGPAKRNYIFTGLFIFIMILSWILFIKFGISKKSQ